MSTKKDKKKKRKAKKGNFTPIAQHKRSGSVLSTVASDLNMEMIEWERDLMPEHLWIDLLANEYEKLQWFKIYNDFLDKIDSVSEEERKTPFLGLISDFGILTEKEKENFLVHHKDFAYEFFFGQLAKYYLYIQKVPLTGLFLTNGRIKSPLTSKRNLTNYQGLFHVSLKRKIYMLAI